MEIVQKLRKALPFEEIDYPFLLQLLNEYANPRAKITWLLKNKVLLRVKKGLYVFGPDYARGPYSLEVLANLIYGPSYISMEYALSFHGLIPERVELVTSVTPKRDKEFTTPVGCFKYRYLHPSAYCVGISHQMIDEKRKVMIATPEKALADLIVLSKKKINLSGASDIKTLLYDDLRIDGATTFDTKLFGKIATAYQNADITELSRWIRKGKK